MPHSPNKPYIVILSVGVDKKVTKYINFATSAEANAHIVKFQGQYPKAFVHENPGNWCSNHTYVDMDAKTFNFIVQEDLDASAMESWENQIAYTDGLMPRVVEDVLDGMADKSGVPQITLDRLQAKKNLRATKP
jgi:hypothetical protein